MLAWGAWGACVKKSKVVQLTDPGCAKSGGFLLVSFLPIARRPRSWDETMAVPRLALTLLAFCCSALAFQAAPLHVRAFSTHSFPAVPIFAREGDGDGMGGAVGGAVLGGLLAGP